MKSMHFAIDRYPYGKSFAISLVDDTDWATLPTLRPVYEALNRAGIMATKTVWPLMPEAPSGSIPDRGVGARTATLLDLEYRAFCQDLQESGHELAMHTASAGDNCRTRTIEAYDRFEDVFGHPPDTNVMHGRNRENIYWGKDIFNSKLLRHVAAAFEPQQFLGHIPGSEYYWGDICRTRTKYVRLLETTAMNTLAFDPATPFHDPNKPDVPWWFSATYGPDIAKTLTPTTVEGLRAQRGTSIIHTYLFLGAKRLAVSGYDVDPRFQRAIDLLGGYADGWYVPVGELLDRIRAVRTLTLSMDGQCLGIRNDSEVDLPALAILIRSESGSLWYGGSRDVTGEANGLGQFHLGDLSRGESIHFKLPVGVERSCYPPKTVPNYFRLFRGTVRRLGAQYVAGEEVVPILTGRVPNFLSTTRRYGHRQ